MLIKAGKYAILCGYVPRDADVRQTQSGKMVVNFSVKRGETSNEDGTKTAQWINCVAWQRIGEIARYIQKGDVVLCTGELQERTYDTRDGDTRTVTELVCEFVQIMQQPSAAPFLPNSVEPQSSSSSEFEEAEVDDDLPWLIGYTPV